MQDQQTPRSGAQKWVVLTGAFLLLFASVGLSANGMALFLVPVAQDLGFSQTAFSLYMTLSSIPMMLCSPLVGRFWSRNFHHLRPVVAVCGVAICGLFMAYSLCTQLWQFYLLSILRGFFIGFVNILPASMLVNNWFTKNRAFFTSITFMGSSLGGMVFTQVSAKVIENVDWRTAYMVLGALCFVVYILVIPLVKPFPKQSVSKSREEKIQTAEATEGFTLGEATRMPSFWMTAIGFALGCCASMGIQQCIASSLQLDHGYSATVAANCYTVFTGVLIFGKLIMGWLYDQIGVKRGLIYMGTMLVLTSVCLLLSRNILFGVLAAVCFGLGNTSTTITSTTVTQDIFGQKDYGSIYGMLSFFCNGGMALGLTCSSAIYDLTGSYRPAWVLYIVFNVTLVTLLQISKKLAVQKKANLEMN